MSTATPSAAYEINIQTRPSATVQLNALRGRVFLPHSCASTSKSSFLVVFATGPAASLAKAAGANRVGGEELVEEILNGSLVPDKLITTPELLTLFTRNPTLARLLGPKNLMPSVKRGTVASDIEKAVKEARGGLDWKGDAKGVVRAGTSSDLSSFRLDFS
jgi:large subunit ribosomal protein L1